MKTKGYTFSASSIKEYLQCGLKFKYGRVDKRERTITASHHRWFGTMVHNLIYAAIAEHKSGKDLKLRKVPDEKLALNLLNTVWDAEESNDPVAKIVLKDMGERPTGKFATGKIKALGKDNEDTITQAQLEEGWKKEARKMVKNGIKVASQVPHIVELEYKLLWTMLGRRFVGYADILAQNDEGKYEFYDFKTSWNKPQESYVAKDFQFFAYSMALHDLLDLDYYPDGHLVHLRSGAVVTFHMTPEIRAKMLHTLKDVFDFIEMDIYFDDYDGYLCPYCDFRHICYGDKAKTWQL